MHSFPTLVRISLVRRFLLYRLKYKRFQRNNAYVISVKFDTFLTCFVRWSVIISIQWRRLFINNALILNKHFSNLKYISKPRESPSTTTLCSNVKAFLLLESLVEIRTETCFNGPWEVSSFLYINQPWDISSSLYINQSWDISSSL